MKGVSIRSVILTASLCAALCFPPPSPAANPAAEPDTTQSTADELLGRGIAAYRAADHAAAEQALSDFLENYGETPEAEPALPRLLPLLALARIQLGKLDRALEAIAAYEQKARQPSPEIAEELYFWKGVCQLQEGGPAAARATLEEFLRRYPGSPKSDEALLLFGTTLALEEKNAEAAAHFAGLRGRLGPEGQKRALVLELHCRIAAEEWDAAFGLATAPDRDAEALPQIIAWHTMLLQLGAAFAEREDHHRAIACLQRVWEKDPLIRAQETRLAELRAALAAAKERESPDASLFALGQLAAKAERELEHFRGTKDFDIALRLRLAGAYQALGRHRETALILERAVAAYPPGPLTEEAALNAVRCWVEVERWPRAIECAAQFRQRFPKAKGLPVADFLAAQARQSNGEPAEAAAAFEAVARDHPAHELAPRAWFLKGYSELLQEEYERARETFGAFPSRYPKHPMEGTALHWEAMALSLAKQHAEARELFGHYVKRFPKGDLAGEARYRRAYSSHAAREYIVAIREFREFLRDQPAHPRAPEVRLLLGDALLATGDYEEGLASYREIPAEAGRFFEEAWFKAGKALRALERYVDLAAHMGEFVERRAGSPRVAEAVYWIGWVHRREGQDDKARAVYRDAIEKLGDDPERRAVEDLFLGMGRLRKEDPAAYRAELETMAEAALAAGRKTLAMRAYWARAQLEARTHPARSAEFLLRAAPLIDPATAAPAILADVADAHHARGDRAEAERLYRALIQWNPRSPERPRALARLGLLIYERGRHAEAEKLLKKFAAENVDSPLAGRAGLVMAEIQRLQRRPADALATLEAVLAQKTVPARDKAEALLAIAEQHRGSDDPARAVPYYQRVYVMYGRWPDLTARAYLRSGEAFESLRDVSGARRTYEEMLGRDDLRERPEWQAAEARLRELERGS